MPCSSKSRYPCEFLVAQEGTHALLCKNGLAPQRNRKIGQGLREGNCRPITLNTPPQSFLLHDPIQLTSHEHTTHLVYAYIHLHACEHEDYWKKTKYVLSCTGAKL